MHRHAQRKWNKLCCGSYREVDLGESWHHKSYHNFYHKSYRQRQSQYPSTTKMVAQTNKSSDSARGIPKSDPIFIHRRGSFFFSSAVPVSKNWLRFEYSSSKIATFGNNPVRDGPKREHEASETHPESIQKASTTKLGAQTNKSSDSA